MGISSNPQRDQGPVNGPAGQTAQPRISSRNRPISFRLRRKLSKIFQREMKVSGLRHAAAVIIGNSGRASA